MNLDVFRGLAGLLMVYNHAGFAWLAAEATRSGASGAWVFVTSMAPVLFFFATGVGMGWSARPQAMGGAIWRKALWLLLADLLLNWGQGVPLGLNFFGFIGVAMLAVGAVRSARRPVFWALLVIAILLALRFAPMGTIKALAQQWPLLAIITGTAPVKGVGYPMSPWLVYPLAGFVLAYTRVRWAAKPPVLLWGALLGLSTFAALIAAVMAWRGAVVHRWDTMSAAYFLASIAVLGVAWMLVHLCVPRESLAKALALRGPASLLVVPVHYAAIGLASAALSLPLGNAAWWVLATALVIGALPASRVLASAMAARAAPTAALHAAVAGLTAATLAALATGAPHLLTLCMACLGQIAVAWELTDAPKGAPQAEGAFKPST